MSTERKVRFCRKCNTETERYKNGQCAPCAIVRAKEWKANNRGLVRKYDKKYRSNNKEKLSKYGKDYHARIKEKWYTFLREQGKDVCENCGYKKSMVAIDYHHKNPDKKEFNISNVRYRSFTRENKCTLLAELEKCEVLCSNCHRELHERENK